LLLHPLAQALLKLRHGLVGSSSRRLKQAA
jgi:hypothetical protein